jgi:hypothetical protein
MQTSLLIRTVCCNEAIEVSFDSRDFPVLPSGSYRKNLVCSSCQRILIVSLEESQTGQVLEQELIDL